MAKSILITQCMQNDFVAPVLYHEALPNALHIGFEESSRLLGEDYNHGILMNLMRWAYESVSPEFKIVHIRDWHDASDPSQAEHLKQFGAHCLQHTPGAEFVFEKVREDQKDTVINASGLNDFIGTDLEEVLDIWKDEEVVVGIIGVWTEAKISYLVYDLVTRYPNFKIGVCSALTASSTTHLHYISIEQLKKLLGVRIISSVGEFGKFLSGAVPDLNQGFQKGKVPDNFTFSGASDLEQQDLDLIHYLFRNSKKAEFKVLDGGFSGNVVMKSTSYDINGHEEVPSVVKIGERNSIAREKMSFEKVKDVLGNSAPSIVAYMETGERAGIKYRYASMFDEQVMTFQKFYGESDDLEEIMHYLDVVFQKQLGRFYKASTLEKVDLLDYYWFSSDFAESVQKKVDAIMGGNFAQDEVLEIAGRPVYNVARFYREDLDKLNSSRLIHSHYMSYVHGDLNGANIIIDGQKNVWLIDFFHTHRGHVLKDLVKLENDILYIFMKINSEEELWEATKVVKELIDVGDLLKPLESAMFKYAAMNKAYSAIAHLRAMYPPLIDTDRNAYQLWVALLRYSVHTLAFDECNAFQKRLALYSSGLLAERIIQYARSNSRLRIDYVHGRAENLGMTLLPGRKDRNRDLTEDLEVIKKEGIDLVIMLITQEELVRYGVPDLPEVYRENGLEVKHLEIVDQGIPTKSEMKDLLELTRDNLNQGKKVLVHCVGGVGRTGTLVACFLKQEHGMTSEAAIEEVRTCRSPRAVETKIQEDFVANW